MTKKRHQEIRITIETSYIEEQSVPEQARFVFSYTIHIQTGTSEPVKLLRRHWIITDANNKIQEVRGEGVVGVQPYLNPEQSFTYTSGAILETPVGCMQGSYYFITDDGIEFEAPIPVFRLSTSVTMH